MLDPSARTIAFDSTPGATESQRDQAIARWISNREALLRTPARVLEVQETLYRKSDLEEGRIFGGLHPDESAAVDLSALWYWVLESHENTLGSKPEKPLGFTNGEDALVLFYDYQINKPHYTCSVHAILRGSQAENNLKANHPDFKAP